MLTDRNLIGQARRQYCQRRMKEHPFRYSLTTRLKERVVVEKLGAGPGRKVLEIGCGSAYFLSALRRRYPSLQFNYLGVDISVSALIAANQFYNNSASFMVSDSNKLPFESESIDNILHLDVIEHLPDDRASLNEALRVLRPGGRLIISTPNLAAPLTNSVFCEYLHDLGPMANSRAGYTYDTLAQLLQSVGFEVESVSYSNVLLSELFITISKLGYRTIKPSYRSQAEVFEVSSSFLFGLNKWLFFPVVNFISQLEEKIFGRVLRGHCMIIAATKPV